MIERRSFITGLFALVAAPAIVRAASLMPVKSVVYPRSGLTRIRMADELIATVDASYQSGAGLIVDPLTVALNVGDIITIAGVKAWHRRGGRPADHLRQFVVTAKAERGHRAMFVYPTLDGHGHYRTVDQLPMNRAEIRRLYPIGVTVAG